VNEVVQNWQDSYKSEIMNFGVFHTHISSPTSGKFLTQDCTNDMLFFVELHLDWCIVAPLRG